MKKMGLMLFMFIVAVLQPAFAVDSQLKYDSGVPVAVGVLVDVASDNAVAERLSMSESIYLAFDGEAKHTERTRLRQLTADVTSRYDELLWASLPGDLERERLLFEYTPT